MRAIRVVAGVVVLSFTVVLAACVPSPEGAAIEVKANDLQGDVVKVALNQVLYIDTGDLGADVESYTAQIADESIVEFEPGRNAGDFATYPGFTAVKVGRTEVTMMSDPDIRSLDFTIVVTNGEPQ